MSEVIYLSEITLKKIRDSILDHNISESDTIYLHQHDFDDIALQYRQTYGVSIELPFYFVGVHLTTSEKVFVSKGKLRIQRGDSHPKHLITKEKELYPPFERIYRCGWCGNIVDYDGSLLNNAARNERIRVLENFKYEVKQITVNGKCCPNGHEK